MLRFAPSPTGDMHIGNMRVAIFNYIVSKQLQEEFVLRVEDTDRERNIEGKEEKILELLELFSIKYSKKYIQSQSLPLHKKISLMLLERGDAFRCYCTKEEIEEKKEKCKSGGVAYRYDGKCSNIEEHKNLPHVVRIREPKEGIEFDDLIKGRCSFESHSIDSFVILRANGTPTYNFACAIDDFVSGISLVIRGEDHLSNTPKQLHIRGFLEQVLEKDSGDIKFAHLPIILNSEGKKMSKRDSASSILWLLDEGFLPSAITNYLISIGNRVKKEIFTQDETLEWFSLNNISKSPAKFDLDFLRYINREHIKRLGNRELLELGIKNEHLKVARFFAPLSSTIKELKSQIEPIFTKKIPPKGLVDEYFKIEEITLRLIRESDECLRDYESFKQRISVESGLKGKKLFLPLRVMLTNSEHGEELRSLYELLKDDLQKIVEGGE